MGKRHVYFRCHHTLHCCTDVVCLPTPWDVIQIVKKTGISPYEFLTFITPEDISEVYKSDPTWLKCHGKRYIMALKRHAGKGCFFLNPARKVCTVYEVRPILCRLYPFRLETTREGEFRSFGLHKDVGCPRHRDGKVPVEPLYQAYLEDQKHQQDYADLVRVFNRKRYRDKRPEDFIKMFYQEVPNE